MDEPRYEQIPHTADIAIRVAGNSMRDLFKNSAYGMFDIIADLSGLEKSISININITANSQEELLVSWLDELLYNFYTKGVIFFDFDITDIGEGRLKAKANGRLIGENKNRLKKEIKAATFHNLNIEEKNGKYSVEIVFDV